MKRKHFLQKSFTAGLLLGAQSFPFEAFAKGDIKKLTILHTNDQHSRIEPFPLDGGKFQGLGGFAQRAQLISQIRSEEKNVLLLDSGDIWQGTPYFNLFKGEVEYRLMSEMKYDVATLGNHDFDAGVDGLLQQLPLAAFSFVNCNYTFNDRALGVKILPYKVIVKDSIRIGITGVGIELNGLVPVTLYGDIQYNDPVSAANQTASLLKNDYKCDVVICLSHLGYKYDDAKVSDVVLAKQCKNIDVILGGHTHTFFDRPEEFINAEGKKVIVNQVGWAGIYLGRIDFYFDQQHRKTVAGNGPLLIKK